ncbi:MAG: Crp/Fnr family transcriptional regulator [Chlorobia bacterium]|nr:Crp/Fnr family transcriptional regulator [Fimbriimonadaceae bacterium]
MLRLDMAVDSSRLWYIRNVDLFKNLPESDLDELAKVAQLVEFGRGEEICASGTGNPYAYVIKEGNVRLIMHSPSGKQLTVAILKPGDVIGGADLFGTETGGESAEALSPCTLYRVPVDVLHRFAQGRPEFSLRINKEVNRSRMLVMNRMQDVLFLTVQERLSRLILRLADEFPGVTTSGKRFVNIRLTHQELADLIGANREAVSATLIKLRRSKCVNSVHGFLVLASEELLRTNVAKDAAA